MKEETEVKPFKVDYKCPQCDIGYMRPTGVAYSTYPPQYPHKCNHCDYKQSFSERFPYTIYK